MVFKLTKEISSQQETQQRIQGHKYESEERHKADFSGEFRQLICLRN